ncbi:lipoxygenase family protein [Cystobacter fuscus]|uniref:lipoxygenase family protein n=1 Tax=Cystobacter fuscus TaxID=43 RepID=UPI0037BF6488
MWPLRKTFWNALALFKFHANRPANIPVPRDGRRRIETMSLASQFPGIPIHSIPVADHVPDDEASPLKFYFYELQVAMYRWLSPMQAGLPPIDEDPRKALGEAYTWAHRRLFPAPVLPDEYSGAVDLGFMAVAGPYAAYVERAPEGGYQWDFSGLARYAHHEGLRSLGVRVLFRVDEVRRRLEAVRIESEMGTSVPGDERWALSKKLALCAASTHVSLVRHFNWIHLASGSPFAIATRNCLPARHPLTRLLWPHIYGTQYSNQIVTKGQMARGGDFETTFSFTHEGMCQLFEETYHEYDISILDPSLDAKRRGIEDAGFDTPALDNRRQLFDVIHDHASRYLRLYYASDEQLRADVSFRAWVDDLDRLIPGGTRKVLGGELSLPGTARLIAALIYLVTVEHELLGTGMWNYQLWTHVQPVRVYEDNRREPIDVYQRLVNANFNLNVHRKQLLSDFSYLALEPRGAAAMRTFREELLAIDAKLEQEPPTCWRLSPRILEANINA